MAIFIHFDIARFKKEAEEGNDESVLKIPEPGTWIALVLILGIFAFPVYLGKTRGGKGFFVGIIITILYIALVILFLIAMSHTQKAGF